MIHLDIHHVILLNCSDLRVHGLPLTGMGYADYFRGVCNMANCQNVSATVQMPDKSKKKSIEIVCSECGRRLGPDDYILSIDPAQLESYKAGKTERPRRVNMCQQCYKQKLYDAGFKQKKRKR